jgi:hypothetical protein
MAGTMTPRIGSQLVGSAPSSQIGPAEIASDPLGLGRDVDDTGRSRTP